MTDFDKLLIGGEWVAPSSDQRIEVRSPATLELVGSVPEALEADVDAAVAAARRRSTTGRGRGRRRRSGSRCSTG